MRYAKIIAIFAGLLAFASCGGGSSSGSKAATSLTTTTTVAPTTTTLSEAQKAANVKVYDTALIIGAQRAQNDAFNGSRAAGIQALIDNSYPPTRQANGLTVAQCNKYLYPAPLIEQFVINQSTITPQSGWSDPTTHEVPEGRIYVFQATYSLRHGNITDPPTNQEAHAVVTAEGKAYFFQSCLPSK